MLNENSENSLDVCVVVAIFKVDEEHVRAGQKVKLQLTFTCSRGVWEAAHKVSERVEVTFANLTPF